MKTRATLFACLLTLSATVAAEQYKCFRVADDGNGSYRRDKDEYVDLSTDGDSIRPLIHIRAASKDLHMPERASRWQQLCPLVQD